MTDNMRAQGKQEVRHDGEPTKPEPQFVPAVDIFETEKAVTVIADMPGVNKAGVDVNLEDGILTIKGSMPEETLEAKVLLREYETGQYIRRFTISETIDQAKIEAKMGEGILTLVLPKIEPEKPRRIEVKAS